MEYERGQKISKVIVIPDILMFYSRVKRPNAGVLNVINSEEDAMSNNANHHLY